MVTGTRLHDVIEMDPGRNFVSGVGGADLFVVGDRGSLQGGMSDVITDFDSRQGDKIGLRGKELRINEFAFQAVSSQNQLKLALNGDATLIYLEKRDLGILYLNKNARRDGLGANGGELIRLKDAPLFGSSDVALL